MKWKARMPPMNFKQVFLTNVPYLFIFYVADKLSWLYQYCIGNSAVERLGVLLLNCEMAFDNPLPSFRPLDLLIGLLSAVAVKGIVYLKGKNAKKFRQGRGVWLCQMGECERYCPLYGSGF